jgi:rhodanese-related sulfurtransferase
MALPRRIPRAARSKVGRGVPAAMPAPLVDVEEAARRFEAGEAILLDVREPSELAVASIEGALHVPMRQVPARAKDLPRDRPVLVICHHGGRSQVVADWLRAQGYSAENVAGGIDAWSDAVDDSIPKY